MRAGSTAASFLALGSLVLAGCGGTRLDAHEPKGTFDLSVVSATFPAAQTIARPENLTLEVRNDGSKAAPNVAVTVNSFDYISSFPGLADPRRPVWAIEAGPGPKADLPVQTQEVSTPGSGVTSYVNTWALGPLAAGQTRTFTWRVVPVKDGTYTVDYRFAAGLAGKAKAQLSAGGPVIGHLTATIAGRAPASHVNPATGRVEVGSIPVVP